MDEWTTKDGQKIPVNELSDQHLRNIVAMVLRNACRRCIHSGACYHYGIVWQPLIDEVRRRKLKTCLGRIP